MFSGINPLYMGTVVKRSSASFKCYHSTRLVLGNQVAKQEVNDKHPASSVYPTGLTDVKVNNLEKWVLVWAGKYKKFSDVPNLVNHIVLERARSKARVKTSLIMIALTIVGCGVMIVSGKRAAARGESVVKMNEDFHDAYNNSHADKSL